VARVAGRGAEGVFRGPFHGGRGGRGRPGALAHLVRQPRRALGVAAARDTARRHRALARAAAPVEGRAARRRLRALVLGGAGGTGGSGGGGGGVRRDAVRRAVGLPGDFPRTSSGDTQRHRHRRICPRPGHRRSRQARHRPDAPLRDLRGPDHQAEGRARAAARGGVTRSLGATRALRGGGGHESARPRGLGPRDRAAGVAVRGGLDPRDAAEAGDHPAADPRARVRVPVGLRAARHRQPGGDGVRYRGRRLAGGRHPRGGRRGCDRAARAARRPGVARRRAEHAAARSWPRGRDGIRRARAGRDRVLLGRGRGPDRDAVRGAGRGHLTGEPVRFALLAVIRIWVWCTSIPRLRPSG